MDEDGFSVRASSQINNQAKQEARSEVEVELSIPSLPRTLLLSLKFIPRKVYPQRYLIFACFGHILPFV